MTENTITMNHGSGGATTGDLIHEVFASAFHNDTLDAMEDAAVVEGNLAITTDSFVVTPLEYKGGDIGRLAVCGTVNDLLMRGAVPKYLTSAFILEVGASVDTLKRVVGSMAETAKEAGVTVVAGDTKVIEGNGGIYINTTGVGHVPDGIDISASGAKDEDVIIVSGTMGDHHAAILSERMSVETPVLSDNAPLTDMCSKLRGMKVHTLRDVTRGGLATVLKELAMASSMTFTVNEESIPVAPAVRDFCGLLGLDPMYMGNEGKLVAIVEKDDADKALSAIRSSKYGKDAAIIGSVSTPASEDEKGALLFKTSIGGIRELDVLVGEGLPRIC